MHWFDFFLVTSWFALAGVFGGIGGGFIVLRILRREVHAWLCDEFGDR